MLAQIILRRTPPGQAKTGNCAIWKQPVRFDTDLRFAVYRVDKMNIIFETAFQLLISVYNNHHVYCIGLYLEYDYGTGVLFCIF